jgi:hypothetical protein
MNVVLWVIAGVLAAVLLASGGMKLSRPKDKLATSGLEWTEDFAAGTIKLIGALEVLAAVGLILPALFGIAEVLAPLSALGLVLLMIGARITHWCLDYPSCRGRPVSASAHRPEMPA